MKHIFIVNPTSGKGKAKTIANRIVDVCEKENIEYEMHYTKRPNDATIIAKRYKNEKNIIYSVGGDGTLNEVVNGIIKSKNMLGVIPAGSGNDFYKTLSKYDEQIFKCDLGKINDRYFINIVSFGIDAEVAYNVESMKHKKIPKNQIYNASIIYTFIKYKFKTIEFVLNKEKKKFKYTIVTICNGGFYGNGYNIGPTAKLNDGLFDIYFADKMSKMSIPRLLLKLKKGQHEKSSYVHKRQASKIKIKSNEKITCNIDGEIIFDNEFDVKLISNAILIYNDKVFINKIINQ